MASWAGKIYITTNNINGKIYIGQTMSRDTRYIGSGVYLKQAIKECGKSNFSSKVLVDNIELPEQLNCLEMFYIKLYDSTNAEIGYNLRIGGENKAFKHTQESLEKIQRRSLQPDNMERIKNLQRIVSKNRIGQHCSKQRKLNTMLSKFGKVYEIEVYKNDKLLYTCNFSTEAAELTGVKPSAIRNNLSNLSKSSGGFIFKYKNLQS